MSLCPSWLTQILLLGWQKATQCAYPLEVWCFVHAEMIFCDYVNDYMRYRIFHSTRRSVGDSAWCFGLMGSAISKILKLAHLLATTIPWLKSQRSQCFFVLLFDVNNTWSTWSAFAWFLLHFCCVQTITPVFLHVCEYYHCNASLGLCLQNNCTTWVYNRKKVILDYTRTYLDYSFSGASPQKMYKT